MIHGREEKGALVFGMVDGATLVLGLLLGMVLSHQPGAAVWHAALGGGLAELGGMGLGQYWSDPAKDKLAALANGAGCCLTTIAVGAPFAVVSRTPAAIVSGMLIGVVAVLICVLRAETGWLAVSRTFGLLIIAGALSGASGLL